MKDAEFNKLKKEELIKGYRLCSENSQKHYNAAIHLAQNNFYGIANSHLILAAEEAVKGFLFLIRCFVNDEDWEVEEIFKDHANKHRVAREAYISWKHLLDSLSDSMQTLFQNIGKLFGQDKDTIYRVSTQIVSDNLKRRMDNDNKEELKKEKKWWNKANQKKNRGFYVDYQNKKWKLPEDISQSEYLESKQIVEKMIFPFTLFNQFSEEDFDKMAELYKERMMQRSKEQKRLKKPINTR